MQDFRICIPIASPVTEDLKFQKATLSCIGRLQRLQPESSPITKDLRYLPNGYYIINQVAQRYPSQYFCPGM
jgi:hypothetical protein